MSQAESGTGHSSWLPRAYEKNMSLYVLDQERWSAIVEFAGVMQVTGAALQ